MNRRPFLAAFGGMLTTPVAGCLADEPDVEDDEHACTRKTWDVVLYNDSDDAKSVMVTILDSDDQIVFSDTVEIAPNTDRSSGTELDVAVYYDRSYTFEVTPSEGDKVSKETVINCGRVYIYATSDGELTIRDDSHEGD